MKLNSRVHPDYPFIKAEFAYAAKFEMAEKPNDILCRRVPIALLNKELATSLLPEVVEIMAKEKRWSSSQKKQELEQALHDLKFIK
jgi:glycerol-3-phosphate dehydrogenase